MSLEQLHNMINTLSEEEGKLFISLIKNKQQLGLLEREAEWFSTHHYVGDCLKSECNSSYSGDTDHEFNYRLRKLLLKLFNKKSYEEKYE